MLDPVRVELAHEVSDFSPVQANTAVLTNRTIHLEDKSNFTKRFTCKDHCITSIFSVVNAIRDEEISTYYVQTEGGKAPEKCFA